MLLKVMLVYSPVAVMSLLLTCTVISVDDGLLTTSTGCAGPSSSSTLYVDWLKLTNIAVVVRDNPCKSNLAVKGVRPLKARVKKVVKSKVAAKK